MINIVREDGLLNSQLTSFPAAKANVAIFGTQSSGKSTLMNHVFGTNFAILDTTITRQRCTKGVQMHNISDFNVIDTEGFDSMERAPQDKMFEKQVALFCLALSDVLLINMWMNEIGRYEASHSHILKAIIKASQRVISKQQRKIIFVVRDCTDDADRKILREELSSHMMGIIKAETKKSTLKFNMEYFMMSHFYQNEAAFKQQAKQLLRMISMTRKSNLNNYSDEDRLVYVKNLWAKVTSSQSEIDLKTVEDALRNFALQRIRQQTVFHMEDWLDKVQDLSKYKTYMRFKESLVKESERYYLEAKPKHLREEDVKAYMVAIQMTLDSKQNKKFMTQLLPLEQDRLITEEYEAKIDAMMNVDASRFKKQMVKSRKQLQDTYKGIVHGLREYAKMTRRFVDKIQTANIKYQQHLQHLQNVFKTELETALNEQADKQTSKLVFEESKIRKVISVVEEKHKASSANYLNQIWERVVYRTSNSTLIDKLKAEGEPFTTASLGLVMGNQAEAIVAHYRSLQQKAQEYLTNMMLFNAEDEQNAVNYQKLELIRRVINQLIDSKILEDTRRFKISLLFITVLMFFFYSQFKFILRMGGMGRKKLRRWMWMYTLAMLGAIAVLAYRKRSYFRKFIEPVE